MACFKKTSRDWLPVTWFGKRMWDWRLLTHVLESVRGNWLPVTYVLDRVSWYWLLVAYVLERICGTSV